MDIHMNGYGDGKPLTNFVGLKDGGVAAVTKFKGSSVVQVVVSESDEEVTVAKTKNGKFIVLINTKAFQTAMLCNEFGIGSHACFATDLGYGSLRKFVAKDMQVGENLTAVSIDNLAIDEEVAYELKRTISIAFAEMNKKGGISARYNIGDKEVDSIIARHTI